MYLMLYLLILYFYPVLFGLSLPDRFLILQG